MMKISCAAIRYRRLIILGRTGSLIALLLLFGIAFTGTAQAEKEDTKSNTEATEEDLVCGETEAIGACIAFPEGVTAGKDALIKALETKDGVIIKPDGVSCRMTNKRSCRPNATFKTDTVWRSDLSCKTLEIYALLYLNRLSSPRLDFKPGIWGSGLQLYSTNINTSKRNESIQLVISRLEEPKLAFAKVSTTHKTYLAETYIVTKNVQGPLARVVSAKETTAKTMLSKGRASLGDKLKAKTGDIRIHLGAPAGDDATRWLSRVYEISVPDDPKAAAARRAALGGKHFVVYDKATLDSLVYQAGLEPYLEEKASSPREARSLLGTRASSRVVITFPDNIFD